MTIKIVTDSTCDIPIELLKKYGIIEVPLTVKFEDGEYRDRVDITQEQFFEKLEKSEKLPTTSQVNPSAFADVYEREIVNGNEIISIHISSELSGTYQSAMIARRSVSEEKIAVIDSHTATFALGFIVLKAAELSQKGLSSKEIVRELEDYKGKIKIGIVVDTLEYLKKGGRLSGAHAVIGSLLNIKPILTIQDGKVVVVDKVKGLKRATKRLIEFMNEKGENIKDHPIGITHIKCPEMINVLKEQITQEFGELNFIEFPVGSVISTHAGPGAYCVVFV